MRTGRFVWLAFSMAVAASGAWAQADARQVRNWAAACSNCHGTDGLAQPGMPSLAGANREETTRKLLDYKAGRLPATIMHQLAKGYSDDELAQIAAYFAAKKK